MPDELDDTINSAIAEMKAKVPNGQQLSVAQQLIATAATIKAVHQELDLLSKEVDERISLIHRMLGGKA